MQQKVQTEQNLRSGSTKSKAKMHGYYSTTFILIKDQKKPEQGTEVLKFFDWAYKTGAKQANDLDYASLPDSVVEQVRAAWKTNIKDSSGKPLY